jgi:hypothetical protein
MDRPIPWCICYRTEIKKKCAFPVFEGLLPEPHNSSILRLLFTCAHWHALAKLRMHTDATLDVLDTLTTALGAEFRTFRNTVCQAYATRELARETAARVRRTAKNAGAAQTVSSSRQAKVFNLQTYKFHALGDYVATIRRYGTTDSYSTELASNFSAMLGMPHSMSTVRENSSTVYPRQDIDVLIGNHFTSRSQKSSVVNIASAKSRRS